MLAHQEYAACSQTLTILEAQWKKLRSKLSRNNMPFYPDISHIAKLQDYPPANAMNFEDTQNYREDQCKKTQKVLQILKRSFMLKATQ